MGYNPFRKHRTTRVDYLLLAVSFLASLLLLAWAVGLV